MVVLLDYVISAGYFKQEADHRAFQSSYNTKRRLHYTMYCVYTQRMVTWAILLSTIGSSMVTKCPPVGSMTAGRVCLCRARGDSTSWVCVQYYRGNPGPSNGITPQSFYKVLLNCPTWACICDPLTSASQNAGITNMSGFFV